MNFVCVLLLIGLSAAARCDKFVTGVVWIHRIGTDETSYTYQSCKKGCFDNDTRNDDGSTKCEKCSIIEEEKLCLENADTCQWKSGKCVSQSCPQMAKETNTRHAYYKECVEGSPKEQAFNNDYWNDYKNNYNKDTVSFPGIDTNFGFFNYRNICEDRIQSGTQCRVLPETTKNICYFMTQTAWGNPTTRRSGSDRCLNELYGPLESGVGSFNNGATQELQTSYSGNQTLFKLQYGFSTPAEVCNDDISRKLKKCDDAYADYIDNYCKPQRAYRTPKDLDHVNTKRARTKCHLVYGCMYSKDNERCSVWAVWAFVLVLVLSIVVVVVAIVVVVIVLIPKRRKVESA